MDNLVFGWPEYVWAVLAGLTLLVQIFIITTRITFMRDEDGFLKDVGKSLFAIASVIGWAGFLYFGGFFD